jgi:septal ring factor EnvC (AmiA/AmiB activator)
MTTAPSIAILHKPVDHLNNSILPSLKELREQLAALDEMDKEIAKKQAQLDAVTHDLKMINLECTEKGALLKSLEKSIVENDRRLDAQEAEMRSKTAEIARLTAEWGKLRERFQ